MNEIHVVRAAAMPIRSGLFACAQRIDHEASDKDAMMEDQMMAETGKAKCF
jgi:hypothetical protein